MSAIEFVVRGDAGVVERGSLGGAGESSVILSSGQDISLNLNQGDVLSYVRQGQALQITLIDGQVITIQGFFSPDGVAQNELFVSANGALSQVDLTAGEGNLIYAQYIEADSFGKWSPDDSLYFVKGSDVQVAGVEVPADDVGMLLTPLMGGLGGLGAGLGGAALLGAAALASGGSSPADETPDDGGDTKGEGDGGNDPSSELGVAISGGTQSAGHVVDAADYADGITITGQGTPGATGVVTVSGVSQNVEVDAEGNWTATYTTDQLPGGEYEADVTVTLTRGDETATATDVLVVDTIAEVSINTATVETDGVVNAAEESDGFTLTGTTQEGSSVVVTIDGKDYNAQVTGGNWTLDVPAGTVASGEYDLNVTVTATDQLGNTASTNGVVKVDTVTGVTVDTSAAGGDGTVNQVEHSDGVVVNGVAEANAEVVVTFGTTSQTVQAGSDGSWSATFAAADVPTGTLEVPVTAVSTDPAGNTATASGTVQIDTELHATVETATVEADGVVNAVEHADGVTLTGTSQPGAQVEITFGTGTRTVTADAGGKWSANWSTSEVPTGETSAPVTVRATDAAGNVATANGTVAIDTVADVTVDTSAVAGDGVVNAVEHQSGLRLTGTSEGADTVVVTLGNVTHTAVVASDGTWHVDFADGEFASGEVSIPVTVRASDAAGNTDTAHSAVKVDTFVNRLETVPGKVEGDDIVNNAEAADGITLNGVVEAGSTVMVSFQGTTRQASVDANGNWSVTFDADEIPAGSYDATVTIDATDAAGNVASISDTFRVETEAPDAANIESVTTADNVTRGFSMVDVDSGTSVEVSEFVNGGANASDVAGGSYVNPLNGELQHIFDSGAEVPDGSHLVVTTGDAAGNTNSTLLVLDEDGNSVVDLGAAALGEFNIGAIDLEYASDSELTLSVADLEGLSDNDNSLIIHGGIDDHVTLNGTAQMTGTKTIDGQDYNVFTVGDNGGELIINQDIDFNQSVV